MSNLRYAARTLAKRPLYLVSVVLLLSLATGTITTAISLVNGVLLRPLHFSGSERVVEIWRNGPRGNRRVNLSPKEFHAVASRCADLQIVASFSAMSAVLRSGAHVTYLRGAKVTPGWFSLFGIKVAKGRPFVPADLNQASDPPMILSHKAWVDRFGRDPTVVGKTLIAGRKQFLVVGVAAADPAARYFPADFWLLAPGPGQTETTDPGGGTVLGQLTAGSTLQHLQVELSAVESGLRQDDPGLRGRDLQAVRLRAAIGAGARPMLLALLAASGLLLLIACGNVALLGYLRNAQRKPEVDLRLSLGSTRAAVVRMLFAESFLIASSGCALGLLLATGAVHIIAGQAAAFVPRVTHLRVDGTTLTAAISISLIAALFTGLVPIVLTMEPRRHNHLSRRQRPSHQTRREGALAALVVSEVALSVLLLIGFGLLCTSLIRMLTVNLGFNPQNILTFWVSAPATMQRAPGPFFRDAQEQIVRLPGVKQAGVASNGFFAGSTETRYSMQAVPTDPGAMSLTEVRYVSSKFLQAIGIPLIRGRYYEDTGVSAATGVMVNEAFERSLADHIPFSNQRIYIRHRLREVTGVLANVRDLTSPANARPTVYVPFFDSPDQSAMMAVRTDAAPSANIVAAVQRTILSISQGQPIHNVSTAEAVFSIIVKPAEFRTTMLGTFAVIGYLLSLIGVYSVAAYALAQRQREVGIRMAFGATPQAMFTRFFIRGLRWALLGTCLGVGAGLAITRVISSQLFQTNPSDPWVFGAVALLMGAAACLACVNPALRAMRIDPARFLRYE